MLSHSKFLRRRILGHIMPPRLGLRIVTWRKSCKLSRAEFPDHLKIALSARTAHNPSAPAALSPSPSSCPADRPFPRGASLADITTRRSFLRQAGLASFAPAMAASLSQLSSLLAAAPPEREEYWQMVRRQFAFREDKVPMNAANLCPSPRIVADQVTELTRDIDVDCSFQNRAKFADLLETSRLKVAQHLGVTADEIALVRNTSEANNTINNGLPLKSGDEVVLWDQNHPTNNVAWDVRAARFGLRVQRISTPTTPTDVSQFIQVFFDAFTPNTRVLALTHVSNVSGLRLPVRELCKLARRLGIWVHVDGAQ